MSVFGYHNVMDDRGEQKQDWRARVFRPVVKWLETDVQPLGPPRTDFARFCEHLKPADIVLVEGRTRVAGIIQSVTLSSWSHAALCVGRLADLESRREDAQARQLLDTNRMASETLILLEAELGRGVHLSPVTRYAREHLRLCRPRDLAVDDAARVVDFALARLGMPYNIRQIGDLLRFFFPYGLLPRRWRSSLFEAGHGDMARTICSTLIARAFASVRYPILPTIHREGDGGMVFYRRNARLVTPRDFDHSPYFDVIKYPFFDDDVARYRELDWQDDTQP